MVRPAGGFPPPFTFITRMGLIAQTLAQMLDSLVRVSRRVACGHYASALASACLGPDWPHCTPGYNTPRGGLRSRGLCAAVRTGAGLPRTGTPRVVARLRRPRPVWRQELPFQQFHVLFDSLSKVLFIFRSLYLCAIGLRPVFSLRRNLPPAWSCIPKQPDSSKGLPAAMAVRADTGLSPSVAPCSKGLDPVPKPKHPLQITTRSPARGAISNLGLCRFTRRYWGNPCWFLFLRLLICLSSAGIPA